MYLIKYLNGQHVDNIFVLMIKWMLSSNERSEIVLCATQFRCQLASYKKKPRQRGKTTGGIKRRKYWRKGEEFVCRSRVGVSTCSDNLWCASTLINWSYCLESNYLRPRNGLCFCSDEIFHLSASGRWTSEQRPYLLYKNVFTPSCTSIKPQPDSTTDH